MNILNKLCITLLLASPFYAHAMHVEYPHGMNQEQVKNSPKQLALDYHDVLTAQKTFPYYWSWAKAVPAMLFAGTQVLFSKTTGIQTAPQQAAKEIKQLPKQALSSGEALIYLFQRHGLNSLASFIVNIKNSYAPIAPMVALLKQIKAQNPDIPMRVASNTGPLIWQNSQNSMGANNPFKDLLERGQLVDTSKYANQPVESDQHLSPEPKPKPEFFQSFEREFNNDPLAKKVTIYVDDKKSNVEAAAQNGMVGIHFDRKKENAIPLFKATLADLGIKF